MLRLQRVAWEKKTPLSLSTLRRALSGKQRPESNEVLHALQVLQVRGYGELEQMEYKGQPGWRYGDATNTAQLQTDVEVLLHDGAMTPELDRRETALQLARRKGLLRSREAAAAGVDRSTLARLCEGGLLERLERGLYGLPAAAVREHVDLEIVAKRVPQAVFCLLTAIAAGWAWSRCWSP